MNFQPSGRIYVTFIYQGREGLIAALLTKEVYIPKLGQKGQWPRRKTWPKRMDAEMKKEHGQKTKIKKKDGPKRKEIGQDEKIWPKKTLAMEKKKKNIGKKGHSPRRKELGPPKWTQAKKKKSSQRGSSVTAS